MTGEDLTAIGNEVCDALIDNQANVDLETLDLIEEHVVPLFGITDPLERANRMTAMSALDLRKVGKAIAAGVKHERTLLTPDPTTGITMTSKIVNGITAFLKRTWLVAIVAKFF